MSGHGRIEYREVWLVDSKEIASYLDQELDWRSAQPSGRVRRSRRRTGEAAWERQETCLWVSRLPIERHTAQKVGQVLRGYWAVENAVFRVRDVSYDEDRLYECKSGLCLSFVRNVAINIIGREGYPYIPDCWRDIASNPNHGLYLLRRKRSVR